MNFVGRNKELAQLRTFLSDGSVRGCAVYGARQLGKTAILKRFSEEVPRKVYIQANMGSESTVVEGAMRYIRREFPTNRDPRTFADLLDVLQDICEEAPTLVMIDEYPYISSSLDHADSMLQGFIDGALGDTGSKIIICGSQLSSMLSILEDRSNPLYNRFRMRVEVGPMTFEDTCLFHEGMSDTDQMRMYMVFGGIPLDHIGFSGRTFKDAVKKLLAPGLPFGNIPRNRIASEVGDPDQGETILRAIASGETALRDISRHSGISASTCSKTLSRMEAVGIVERVNPMAGAPKRPRYRFADGLIGLWYTAFDGLNEYMLPDDVDKRYDLVEGRVNTYLGERFEIFCAEFLARHYACKEMGKWWGVEEQDGETVGADIDVIADVTEGGRRGTVFAECKFRTKKAKLSDLERLDRRARALDRNAILVLFSSGGFERRLEAEAWRYGAVLIGPDVLMGREPAPSLLSPVAPGPRRAPRGPARSRPRTCGSSPCSRPRPPRRCRSPAACPRGCCPPGGPRPPRRRTCGRPPRTRRTPPGSGPARGPS